jgi:uroporphyrinogen decarboxylase
MTDIENFISIVKRKGYERVPTDFVTCPILSQKLKDYVEKTGFEYKRSYENIPDLPSKNANAEEFMKYYDVSFKPGTIIDKYGVAHEPGSAAAFHMTKMYHPMASFDSVEQVLAYPLPDYDGADETAQINAVKGAHLNDTVATGNMQCTVWESAWYMRGMENLMTDMMTDDPIAEALFDRVTDIAVKRATSYVKNGVDVLFLGDDIGMQKTIMMSENLYCEWLKPRLKKVIDEARKINPDVVVFYHSCGFVTPMIPHLIEAGIDVLNPVQPECMDFRKIHEMYGDRLSFNGTVGTQTTMPFGTPDEVRREVFKNLDIAGDKGGLLVAPTHMLEPEVPLENLIAYIKACKEYK